MSSYDFANVLFAGPCNRTCLFCIGKSVDNALNQNNLHLFPPKNWQQFCNTVHEFSIPELIFTGTTTDPHLYNYERQLIELSRTMLPNVKISVHTNGVLSLKKIDTFNMYDRATVSLPSFDTGVYQKVMGRGRPIDLRQLLQQATIPVKISTVITEHNIATMTDFLNQLSDLGIHRVALRHLFEDDRRWNLFDDIEPVSYYRNNPVYLYRGMQVTYWHFDTTESRSINLFANGTISDKYLLTMAATSKAPL